MSDKDKEATRLLEEADVVTVDEVIDPSKLELTEQVVQLNRVAKVVKGGRRFSFSALVVIGDYKGHVGIGFGKANEVPESIQKAVQNGKKNLITVPRIGRTIPYAVTGEFGAARVFLRPASEGTGIIAGPAVRAALELAGVKDVLTKNLGTNNAINILKATINALASLRDAEEVARLRGKNLEDMVGSRRAALLHEYSKSAVAAAASAKPQIQGETRVQARQAPPMVVVQENAVGEMPDRTPGKREGADASDTGAGEPGR